MRFTLMAPLGGKQDIPESKKIYRWELLLLLLICTVGLFYRMRASITITEYELKTDALNYHNMAIQLLNGGSFGYMSETSNAYVMPLYPLFLTVIYRIVGIANGVLAAQIVQGVLSTLTAFIGYLIGKRFFGRSVGIIACFCLALYPGFIMGSMCLLTETLYIFLFMLYFYVQLLSVDAIHDSAKKKYTLAALSGALFALAILTRGGAVLLMLVPYLYKYIANRKEPTVRKAVLFEFLFFVGGFAICMLPWWIRNVVVLGELVLFCTQSGNPVLYGTFPDMIFPADFVAPAADKELEVGIERIINGFRTEPLTYLLWYTVGKFRIIFFNVWDYLSGTLSFPYHRAYFRIMHYVLVSIGWTGAIWGLFRPKLRLVTIYAIILTFLQLLVIPTERYALTIMPLLIIAFAVFIHASFSLLHKRKCRKDIA